MIYVLGLCLSLMGITSYKALGYPVSDWLLVFSAGVFVVHALTGRRSIINGSTNDNIYLFLFAFLFYIGGLISSINSSEILNSIINTHRLLLVYIIVPLMFAYYVKTSKELRIILISISLNGFILGFSALLQYMGVYGLSHIEESRITGVTNHPNELGGMSALCFVFASYLFFNESRWFGVKGLSALACAISGLGVFLSSSFTALVVLSGMVFYALWLLGAFSRFSTYAKGLMIVLLVVVLGVGFTVSSGGGYQLYSDRIDKVAEKSVGSRTTTYMRALSDISDNPFIGNGMAFRDRIVDDYQVHNIYLLSWYCAGMLGLLGSIGVMLSPFLSYYKCRSKVFRKKRSNLLSVSLAAFLGVVLITLVAPNMYEITSFFPLFVWAAVLSLVKKDVLFANVVRRNEALRVEQV